MDKHTHLEILRHLINKDGLFKKCRLKGMEQDPNIENAEKYFYSILREKDERFMNRRLKN